MRKYKLNVFGKSVILITFLFLSILVFLFFYNTKHLPSSNTDIKQHEEIVPKKLSLARKYWSEKIKNQGSKKTYSQFRTAYLTENLSIQHSMGHLFGRLLYQMEGLSGFGICDDSYAYGCYHSFALDAIADNSTDIIPTLFEECIKKQKGDNGISCSHGIGHGVTASNKEKDFGKINLECEKLPTQEAVRSCIRGAVMEYNLNLLSDETSGEVTPRTPTNETLYDPCRNLAASNSDVCYFELPMWWNQIFERDFKKIGELCSVEHGVSNTTACFRGAGHTAVEASNYDKSLALRFCDLMPNSEGRTYCYAGANWLLYAVNKQTRSACKSLPSEKQDICEQNSLQIENS